MAVVASQPATTAGLNATYSAASGGGDRVSPGCTVHVKNGNASALTVTMVTPGTVDGLAIADVTSNSIAATTGMAFFKIPLSSAYIDPADGLVGLSWSVTSSVTFAAVSN